MSMMTVDVRSRVDEELKRQSVAVLKASGLDLSTAIRLFLRSVVETGGLPIEIARPNAKTLAAIKTAKANKTSPIDFDDL